LSGIASGVGVGVIRGLSVRMSSRASISFPILPLSADAWYGETSHVGVGQIRLWQAIGLWGLSCSFLSVLGQWVFLFISPAFARRVPAILKRGSPFTQDDMSAEYPGGAEAGADCRRTTSPAGARKAQGLRVTAMTNSNTRRYIRYKKHAYLISTTNSLPYA